MNRTLKRNFGWIVSFIALSPLSQCPWLMHGPNIWHESRREVVIDPLTGDKKRTFYWVNDRGETTTTTDIITRDEDNPRRNDVRPLPEPSSEP